MATAGIYIQYGVFSIVGAGLITLLAFSVDRAIDSLDSMLIPCQHGTSYSNGKCFCEGSPFVGKFCGTCNCSVGTCVLGGTYPRITSDYGCRCPQDSKFFGYLCDQCNAVNKSKALVDTGVVSLVPIEPEPDCRGDCDPEYFGPRCERRCFANVSYADTLSMNSTGDDKLCRDLRVNGGTCSPCSGHGTCHDGFCQCFKNYFDDGFDLCSKTCPVASNGQICSGKGVCKLFGSEPSCLCESGYRGTQCEIPCPGIEEGAKSCHGHGSCSIDYEVSPPKAQCQCVDLYVGDACQIKCPGENDQECTGHGTCVTSGGNASCICETSPLPWNGRSCNCTDLLSCNGRGVCESGQCKCQGNFDGKNCRNCKPNWYGTECNFYCDNEADYDDDPTRLGCHGNGQCTVFNQGTIYESIACECERNEVLKRVGDKTVRLASTFNSDIFCKDCLTGYFPKVDVFNQHDTTPLDLHVPCQIQCVPSTCNNQGECNDKYGMPGEQLCSCSRGTRGQRHLNASIFCMECETNWYPEQLTSDEACSNFCVDDLADIGGSFPAICDEGDIDCVHCSGSGTCNPYGVCECQDGFTGDHCQIQCTSDSGIICGGHGVCETNDLQSLLQYELEFVEDSGPAYQCTCDPQDPFTKEARERYIAEGQEGELDPPPNATYFGETCDYHCLTPPWKDADECNGMGNCTIYEIRNPLDMSFPCYKDADCETTDVRRITSTDVTWHDKKGPFCKKIEYPEGCEGDNYHVDDCLEILTLQRPPQSRSEACMETALCRQTMESYDWHNYCSDIVALTSPPLFKGCGAITQFCPVQPIHPQCTEYINISNGINIKSHMDYCYEIDRKRFPFAQTYSFRMGGESSVLHGKIYQQMETYHNQYPDVDINIDSYCVNHMLKFKTEITKVNTNERYTCGSSVVSDDSCVYGATKLGEYKPFAVQCPNEDVTSFATLAEAEEARGHNCMVIETERRYLVETPVAYGGKCYEDSDCEQGVCSSNTCCTKKDPNCEKCNSQGQCAQCAAGTSWSGTSCVGTPVVTPTPSLTGLALKEGIDMIDTTCASATATFPQCLEPSNACDLSACNGDDTCVPDGTDGICTTKRVLNCTCAYGLECVPLSFNSYKCVGNFQESSCPQEAGDFNWFGYCSTNSPVLKTINFSNELLTKHEPADGYTITLSGSERSAEMIHYWVQPTTIFSSSKYMEIKNNDDVVARVYLHQGQIQLNRIGALQSCPLTQPTCQEDFGYEPNTWYQLEVEIDYVNRVVKLHKDGNTLSDSFICTSCTGITTITSVSIVGSTTTYYDEIVFEKSIPLPSIHTSCSSYKYCDVDVDYRKKCSDIIRNVKYPLLLEPQKDIVSTCANFFEYQSFSMHQLTFAQEQDIKQLDWDGYCLFHDSFDSDSFDCASKGYSFYENYTECGELFEPLNGSKVCMDTALTYDWTDYCEDLILAAIPTDIKAACPKKCYKTLKNYDRCQDRLDMFQDNHHLKASQCGGDWVDFCRDVTMNKHKGVCSAVSCLCDSQKYEGISGDSCELHCLIASDGSPCGEESGVGVCSYSEHDKKIYDQGKLDEDGNWIAWDTAKYELTGECQCFLSEGKNNCDRECLNCNEEPYDIHLISPKDPERWKTSGVVNAQFLYLESPEMATVSPGSTIVIDLTEEEIVTAIAIRGDIESINVSISVDNDYFEGIGSEVKPPVITTAPLTPQEGSTTAASFTEAPTTTTTTTTTLPPVTAVEFGNVGSLHYTYDGDWDPTIDLCVNEDYIFRRTSSDHPLVVVKTADCVGCATGSYTSFSNELFRVEGNSEHEHTFTETGTYWYLCAIHSGMVGRINVGTCGRRRRLLQDTQVPIHDYDVRGYGRFVKVEVGESGSMNIGVRTTRSGQIGICNAAYGACQCLPPFTTVIEEKYTNWRGQHSKRLKRLYNLPEKFNEDDEFRLRAMQGKESFIKEYLKDENDELVYDGSVDWKEIYGQFRDTPSDFYCKGEQCNANDFMLLGSLHETSFRYNYDCNSECQGTDPDTLIPCSGHGSCKVTGDCICDPAAYIKGTDKITGFSQVVVLANGETVENSDYEVNSYDMTGWRGLGCEKMCPGYDPVTKSMLNVCGGHGTCNNDAACECALGYTGEFCQFECPGFKEGDQNVCSGHGTCTMNLLEIVYSSEIVLYEGHCDQTLFLNETKPYSSQVEADCLAQWDQVQSQILELYSGYTLKEMGKDTIFNATGFPSGCQIMLNHDLEIYSKTHFNRNSDDSNNDRGRMRYRTLNSSECLDPTTVSTVKSMFNTRYSGVYTYTTTSVIDSDLSPDLPYGCQMFVNLDTVTETRMGYNTNTNDKDNILGNLPHEDAWARNTFSLRVCKDMEGGIVILSDPDERCDTYYESHRVCDGPTLLKDPTYTCDTEYQIGKTTAECIDACKATNESYTASIRKLDGGCFCSLLNCSNPINQLTHDTYGRMGLDVEVDPIDCNGVWSDWSECNGEREERFFRIKTLEEDGVNGQPRYGGKECPVSPEYRQCFLKSVDCDGTWSSWSDCTGTMNRTFTQTRAPQNNGLSCPLSPEVKVCSLPKIDCEGSWSQWSPCTNFKQQRTFTVTTQPENKGLSCPESPQEIECSSSQINCVYTASEWSACDKGTQTKTYTVLTAPQNNGVSCPVDETRSCDTCVTNDQCTSQVCKGNHCCSDVSVLCKECARDSTCKKCIENSHFDLTGKCVCDKHMIFDGDECTLTWNILKEPKHVVMGDWTAWTSCKSPGPKQTRVRSKHVSLFISENGPDMYIDGIPDGHFKIEMARDDPHHYTNPYIPPYESTVILLKTTPGDTLRVVSEADCSSCSTGTWSTLPNSTAGPSGTAVPDIKFGLGQVEWSPTIQGTYYIISVESPSKIVKLSVDTDGSAYEEKVCTLLDNDSTCGDSAECLSGSCVNETCSHALRRLRLPENECDDECHCLGGHCCKQEYPHCTECNRMGVCSQCAKDTEWKFGKCVPVSCSKKYDNPHMKFVHGRGCVHKFGSSSCTQDNDCGEGTNGQCIGGVCCNANYTDTTNCRTCNDGKSMWDYNAFEGYMKGSIEYNACQDVSPTCLIYAAEGRCTDSSTAEIFIQGDGEITVTTTTYSVGACFEFVNVTCGGSSLGNDNSCDSGFCGGIIPNVPELGLEQFGDSYEGDASVTTSSVFCCANQGEIVESTSTTTIPAAGTFLERVWSQYMTDNCKRSCNLCEDGHINEEPLGYSDATALCDSVPTCSGIYQKKTTNQWYARTNGEIITPAIEPYAGGNTDAIYGLTQDYVTYVKTFDERDYCSECIQGSFFFRSRGKCIPEICPIGQTFIPNIGCRRLPNKEEDKNLQGPIERALSFNRCYDGFYKDIRTGRCEPVREHPMIPVTLYIDEGTEDEVSLDVICEVWGVASVKCPQCNCYLDAVYGKWSSFECETCLKGYGQKQCSQICPAYDGENEQTICNGFGKCNFGSSLNKTSGLRSFEDGSCTCGSPPGSLNRDKTEMQVYNTFYTQLTTITEQKQKVICLDEATIDFDGQDTCYHFDESISDCSACDSKFSGKNCQFKCEKCLMSGSCRTQPSDIESAECDCPKLYGQESGLWSMNCCPTGFRVTDVKAFDKFPQIGTLNNFGVDQIAMATVNNNGLYSITYKIFESGMPDKGPSSVTESECNVYAIENDIAYTGYLLEDNEQYPYGCIRLNTRVIFNDYPASGVLCTSLRKCVGYEPGITYAIRHYGEPDLDVDAAQCQSYAQYIEYTYQTSSLTTHPYGCIQSMTSKEVFFNDNGGLRHDCGTYFMGCIVKEGSKAELRYQNAEYWCKKCPGVSDDMWLQPEAKLSVCGGVARGTCIRKNNYENGCMCNRGNGGDPLDASLDFVGYSCRCRAQDAVPFRGFQEDYGCYGIGQCVESYIEQDGLQVGCLPAVGSYLKLIPLRHEQVASRAEPGYYVPDDGQIHFAATPCPKGSYQPDYGQTQCLQCEIGQYADEEGLTFCKQCAGGTFTPYKGTANCQIAAVGRYSSNGLTNPGCNYGAYQDQTGQSGCKNCPKGTYGKMSIADSCVTCPAGRYTSRENVLGGCFLCNNGEYQDNAGAHDCKYCNSGHASSGRFTALAHDRYSENSIYDPNEYTYPDGEHCNPYCSNYNRYTWQCITWKCSTSYPYTYNKPWWDMNYLSKKLDVDSAYYSVSQVVGEVERAEYYDSSNDCFKCNEGNDIQYYHDSVQAQDYKVSSTGVHDTTVTKAMCKTYAARQGYDFKEVTSRDTAFGCIENHEVDLRTYTEYNQFTWQYVQKKEYFDKYSVSFVTPETILTEDTYATQTIRQDECQNIYSDNWGGVISSWTRPIGCIKVGTTYHFNQDVTSPKLCGKPGITDKLYGLPDLSVDSLKCEQFALQHGKPFAIADETGNPKGCFRQGNNVYYNTNAASTASCGAHGVSFCLEDKSKVAPVRRGNPSIDYNITQCQQYASDMQFTWGGSVTENDSPQGCYLFESTVYYNNDATSTIDCEGYKLTTTGLNILDVDELECERYGRSTSGWGMSANLYQRPEGCHIYRPAQIITNYERDNYGKVFYNKAVDNLPCSDENVCIQRERVKLVTTGLNDVNVDLNQCLEAASRLGRTWGGTGSWNNDPKGCYIHTPNGKVYFNTGGLSTECSATNICIQDPPKACIQPQLDKCVELYETKCVVTAETVTYQMTKDSGQSQSAKDSMTEADCKAYSEQLKQKSYINLVQYSTNFPAYGCTVTAGYQRYLYYGDNTYVRVAWGSGEKKCWCNGNNCKLGSSPYAPEFSHSYYSGEQGCVRAIRTPTLSCTDQVRTTRKGCSSRHKCVRHNDIRFGPEIGPIRKRYYGERLSFYLNGWFEVPRYWISPCEMCKKGGDYGTNGASEGSCGACKVGRFAAEFPNTNQLALMFDGTTRADWRFKSASDKTGACTDCFIGRYQDQTGQNMCKDCPVGQYQNEHGKSGCKSCPSGKTTGGTGRQGIDWCISRL